MSVVAAAIVTSSVVGAVGAERAGDKAAAAGANRISFDQQTLAFERERFDQEQINYVADRDYRQNSAEADRREMQQRYETSLSIFQGDRAKWDEVYGNVEKNLGDFYKSLTPETFAAAGIQHEQQNYKQAMETIQTSLAQRGMDSSGIMASVTSQAELNNAEAKANIRHEAPLQVAQAQAGFVQSSGGKPGNTPTVPGIPGVPAFGTGPSGNGITNARNNISDTMGVNAANDARATQDMWNSAGNIIGAGMQMYTTNSAPSANGGSYTINGGSSGNQTYAAGSGPKHTPETNQELISRYGL
jgi:hypothetical protein